MSFRGGMGELLRQANRMQRKIEKRREELASEVFESKTGNDRVTVVANGGRELVEIKIDEALLKEEGLEMALDLIVAAANAALKQAKDKVDAEVEELSGGLKIPGLG